MLAFCFTLFTLPAAPPDDDFDKKVAALIEVFRHPEARGTRLDDSRRAIRELAALGKPAVPKLLDVMFSKDDTAMSYTAIALKGMPAADVRDELVTRWEKADSATRWRIVSFNLPVARESVEKLSLDGLTDKNIDNRIQSWSYILGHAKAPAFASVKERYLKALAGDELPAVRWMMLTDAPVFDAEKEADLLIALLKPGSWAAKGEGRIPPNGWAPAWWPDGRDHVVEAIGHRKLKKAVPAFLELLAEKGQGKAYFGHAVMPVLGDFGDKAVIPELKRVLAAKDDHLCESVITPDFLRALAARALLQLDDTSGRAFIKEQLTAKQFFHRRYAAETLARFGTKDDIPTLAAALDDEDWGVQRAVCQGLERITGVKNRGDRAEASEADVPLWKEWFKKQR
jgi:hypothetical protein